VLINDRKICAVWAVQICTTWINVIAETGYKVDVIFVVDESWSVRTDDFNLTKMFLTQLVGRLDSDCRPRVGLVTYSTDVDTAEAFNLSAHSSVADVQSAIDSLSYSGGHTYTHLALEYVRTVMLTSAAGDRPDVPNVVVVLTDGLPYNVVETRVCIRM